MQWLESYPGDVSDHQLYRAIRAQFTGSVRPLKIQDFCRKGKDAFSKEMQFSGWGDTTYHSTFFYSQHAHRLQRMLGCRLFHEHISEDDGVKADLLFFMLLLLVVKILFIMTVIYYAGEFLHTQYVKLRRKKSNTFKKLCQSAAEN